ncbi:MAG: HAMP domain-containing histidine kinase [Lachnospiraceae bacterium]|nr:HAMP domain-containing histidine kinase [Lachnospiraceae bacterium]
MTKSNSSKPRIRTRLFVWTMAIVLLSLAVIWILLGFNLDSVYRAVRTSEIRSVLSKAESVLKDGGGDYAAVGELCEGKDARAYVLDSAGQVLYAPAGPFAPSGTMAQAQAYYEAAKKEGGEVLLYVEGDLRNGEMPSFIQDLYREKKKKDNVSVVPEQGDTEDAASGTVNPNYGFRPGGFRTESLIAGRIVTAGEQDVFILLTALLTPVDATVKAVRMALAIVSAAVILLAAAAALLFAGSLSGPIEEMSKSAMRLAKADYAADYPESGLREIDTLSETLKYAAGELERTEYLRRELISNVGHDLRTPLTMIRGYAEVMRDIPGEVTAENMQVIIDETDRLSGLVNDLLETSRLEADVAEMRPVRYDLTESIRSVLSRYNKLIENEGYRIGFTDDGPAYVEADRERIYQVIYNLVGNAVNYTDEQTKNVEVYETVRNGRVRVEVRDHGSGILKEELPYVWDRYYRSSEAHRRAKVGTGLGLSIAKGILEAHHALYGVESTVREGSLFWFELPLSGDQGSGDAPEGAGTQVAEARISQQEAAEMHANEAALRDAETREVQEVSDGGAG